MRFMIKGDGFEVLSPMFQSQPHKGDFVRVTAGEKQGEFLVDHVVHYCVSSPESTCGEIWLSGKGA